MPRKMRVPSYRLHRPSGQAVVTLSGHDHYLGLHGSAESQAEYRRLIAEYLAGSSATVEPGPGLSVSEALLAYWAFAESYYRKHGEPTSQLDRVRRSLAVARDLYGGTPAAQFGPKALKACRAAMVSRGWCRAVVNQRVECLRRAFKWAVGEELLPGSIYEALRTVERLKRGRTEAPESPEVGPAPEAAIEAAQRELPLVLARAVSFQLLTAARPGEALALRPGDLDRKGPVWLYRPGSHKTEHHDDKRPSRLILIGPRAQELITPWLNQSHVFSPRLSMALFRERQREARRSKVQPSQQDRKKTRPRRQPGERYRVDSYGQAVLRACDRAGVERWHPHQLRHNAATRLVAQFGWDTARIILGHRCLDATRIYALDDLEKAMSAIRQVG